jgi:hypothetical protein
MEMGCCTPLLIKKRSEQVTTPWYKNKLESLATNLWKNRYLLFKAEKLLFEEEREKLEMIITADQKVGTLRAFLGGIWNIFEHNIDEKTAKEALEALKEMPTDPKEPEAFKKVVNFLEEHFEWMTA